MVNKVVNMNKQVSERLEAILQEKNIKQKDLAANIGVTEVTISRYLNDERKPHLDIIIKMAEYLGVSTDYLLGMTESTQPTGNSSAIIEGHLEADSLKAKDKHKLTFGAKIKEARKERGLTQEEVVEEIRQKYPGVDFKAAYLCMLENETKVNPTTKVAAALLNYYGLATEDENNVALDIRKISRAAERMTPEKRQQWLEIAKVIAPEAFHDSKDKNK
jgi:transcriptional regulator with XRE-family HTH domain